ncbi:DDE-type integrase/transposase/recombinase, partial [Mycoplasma phocimorsus]|uniref:DDE-type integrase/transposase/recombinase n=1 Tax=Mycoplasma phocimorsus TaxID=3045839 RepID=UPI002972C76B|nr:transposase [Mycoplasma phocimorsus]
HVYLSAIICHKTKQIISWKISTKNNLNLVFNNIRDLYKITKGEKFIIHSDHGFQYTSKVYIEEIQNNNGVVSLSRVGNYLDNREIEYWFSVFKTEFLKFKDPSKLTFKQFEKEVSKFVTWYNNGKIQKNLGWKKPQQVVAA